MRAYSIARAMRGVSMTVTPARFRLFALPVKSSVMVLVMDVLLGKIVPVTGSTIAPRKHCSRPWNTLVVPGWFTLGR
jgi:hypothetical protein